MFLLGGFIIGAISGLLVVKIIRKSSINSAENDNLPKKSKSKKIDIEQQSKPLK